VIHYLATRGFQNTLRWFCDGWGRELAHHLRFLTYDQLRGRGSLPAGAYIFADLERLDPETLDVASRAWRALTENRAGPGPVLNDPIRSMRRYELLRTLFERGINDFDVYRLTEARRPRRFPVFLRGENDHEGPISALLHTPAELEKAIEAMICSGGHRQDKLVEEFVDVADRHGAYHLFSAFAVGTEIIPGYLDFSHHWVVKDEVQRGGVLSDPEFAAPERHYLQMNPHEDILREVFALANIQYGRVDYAMVDGQIRVFEINTNPNVIEYLDVGGDAWKPNAQLLASQFIEAMRRVDGAAHRGGSTRLPPSRRQVQAAWSHRLRVGLHVGLRSLGLLRHETTLTSWALRARARLFGW
jgi:hypothetical protein